MTDALDMSIDALYATSDEPVEPPSDPWLQRRALGFGCSELAVLFVALGWWVASDVPRYMRDNARTIASGARVAPRIFLQKAGLVQPLAAGAAASAGQRREHELLTEWTRKLEHGSFYCEAEALVVPGSVRHADDVPRAWLPLVDRHAPRLVGTPDAWASDVLERLVNVQLKTSVTERRELPAYWHLQVQGELAVTGSDWGLLVLGERWAADYGTDGPIRAFEVPRDESLISRIREAVTQGWNHVEKLRCP